MNWARALAGVVLTFVGVWEAFFGITRAIEPRLVQHFWGNQNRYTERKRAAHG